MAPRTDFPPVRATLFDMDGLLIDSEDAYSRVTNTILRENGKSDLPWNIKAQMQGRPGPAAGRIFFQWSKLPISEEQFMARQKELQAVEFLKCRPLPGVEKLLKNLYSANTKPSPSASSSESSPQKVQMAVATSSHRRNFEIKTGPMQELFSVFPQSQIVVGDDDRVPRGRGKPLPDIYLLALDVVNQEISRQAEREGGKNHIPTPIRPEECLVFEDSVPGVEAGRRAGMRVVWCPHPGLYEVYKDRVDEVLAGRTGEHKESDLDLMENAGIPLAGSPGHIGEIDDGWAELLHSLEDFHYSKYGIDVNESRPVTGEQSNANLGSDCTNQNTTSDKGTTDKALEEMTAKADGKLHAREEGTTSAAGISSPVPGLLEDGKL